MQGQLHATATGRRVAFTLIELLVAITVLSVLLVILFNLVDSASKTWSSGNQRSQLYQSARAVIEMIGREVSQAEPIAAQSEVNSKYASSPLVINPPLTLPAGVKLLQDSSGHPMDSLFFYSPLRNTAKGPLDCVGYFVNADHQLCRLGVAADNSTYTGASTTVSYMAVASLKPYYLWRATDVALGRGRNAKLSEFISPVSWLNNSAAAFADAQVTSPVAEQVIGFAVRPIGRDGNPLPSAILPSTAPAYVPGSFGTGGAPQRTYNSAWFPVADRLPTEIEVTLVLCEARAFTQLTSQGIQVPVLTMPDDNSDAKLQAALDDLKAGLLAKKVTRYVILTKRFPLVRGAR